MAKNPTLLMRSLLVVALTTVFVSFQNCSGSGGGGSISENSAASGDWYYHWNCNGDAQCLSTNPTGAASGTLDEGPAQASCTSLLTFASHFWGSGAVDSCDQSPSGSGGGGSTTDNVFAILNPVNTYWYCDPVGQPFSMTLTETSPGVGSGFFQKATIAASPIVAYNWQEGSDQSSFSVTTLGSPFAGLIEISPNAISHPTSFTYLNGAKECTLKAGTLPGVPQQLANGYIFQGGLTWMPNTLDGVQPWSAANTYCMTATINGSTGWRLPTFAELSQMFSSGAIGLTAQENGWGSVSLGGGANPTWTSDSAGTGSHKSVSELVLTGFTATDSTLYQVTCVK